MPMMPLDPITLQTAPAAVEYGMVGVALVGLAGFTGIIVRNVIASAETREIRRQGEAEERALVLRKESDRREARLTLELAQSRKAFIEHLEKGAQEQVAANLAIATQIARLNDATEANDAQAQKRHDSSMKVLQEMSNQLSWYRERHDGEAR